MQIVSYFFLCVCVCVCRGGGGGGEMGGCNKKNIDGSFLIFPWK